MPPKLKRADELHQCAKRIKQNQEDARMTKCIETMDAAAEKGMYEIYYNEVLSIQHLDDLKKAGYIVERQFTYDAMYKISWANPQTNSQCAKE